MYKFSSRVFALALLVGASFVAASADNPFAAAAASFGVSEPRAKCEAVVAEGRICFTAQINSQPVKLAFDTGASSTVLFRASAERLGLKIHELPRGRREDCPIGMSRAEGCALVTPAGAKTIRPDIFNCESFLPGSCDGILSWNELKDSLVEIDMAGNSVKILGSLPSDIGEWTPHRLVPAAWMLGFECRNGTEIVRVGIDTGSPDGVWLNAARWQKWCAAHPGTCQTFDCFSSTDDGMIVSPVLRAKKIALGGLALEDVPVRSFTTSESRSLNGCDCVLGTFALSRLRLIVDGRHGVLYTRPASAAASYSYNRLGAVFVKDSDKSAGMVAHVAAGSPAAEAGIRDGDVLVKVSGNDVSARRMAEEFPRMLNRQCRQGVGSKLTFTLERSGRKFETEATLREVPFSE